MNTKIILHIVMAVIFSYNMAFANPWELRARFASNPPNGYYVVISPINATYYGYDFYPRNPGSTFPDEITRF